MKSSITTTEIFKYILAFTLIFSAFLALAITYNKVYKLKNEVLAIIEKYEGVTDKSLGIINNYLKSSGYNTLGHCDDGEYGISSLDNTNLSLDNSKKHYYCLNSNRISGKNGDKIYYDVKLFFKFNLPFIGELLTFKITGETKAISLYSDSQLLS